MEWGWGRGVVGLYHFQVIAFYEYAVLQTKATDQTKDGEASAQKGERKTVETRQILDLTTVPGRRGRGHSEGGREGQGFER